MPAGCRVPPWKMASVGINQQCFRCALLPPQKKNLRINITASFQMSPMVLLNVAVTAEVMSL